MYEKLKYKLHETALESLGVKTYKKISSYWWSEDLTEIIKEKKYLYLKWLSTRDDEDRKSYNRYKYMVKKEVIRAKNEAWDKKCANVNSLVGGSRSREAWKTVNSLRRNTNEKRKTNPIDIEQWKNYYDDLLTEKRLAYINVDMDKEKIEVAEKEIITLEQN